MAGVSTIQRLVVGLRALALGIVFWGSRYWGLALLQENSEVTVTARQKLYSAGPAVLRILLLNPYLPVQ